jgi:XTP/dITP diphosphohydrolase
MKLVFATHNQNKFDEVKVLVPQHIELVSLTDIGCDQEIPETADTLEGNAKLKADFVTKNYDLPCFADDTGLLVDALNGAPGVYSARYAGPQKSAEDNMQKLLFELQNKANRSAHFKTAIALNLKEKTLLFSGEVSGEIIKTKRGSAGFGYDPIFKPFGYEQTFAELSMDVKNKISHRGRAIQELLNYLKSISNAT